MQNRAVAAQPIPGRVQANSDRSAGQLRVSLPPMLGRTLGVGTHSARLAMPASPQFRRRRLTGRSRLSGQFAHMHRRRSCATPVNRNLSQRALRQDVAVVRLVFGGALVGTYQGRGGGIVMMPAGAAAALPVCGSKADGTRNGPASSWVQAGRSIGTGRGPQAMRTRAAAVLPAPGEVQAHTGRSAGHAAAVTRT